MYVVRYRSGGIGTPIHYLGSITVADDVSRFVVTPSEEPHYFPEEYFSIVLALLEIYLVSLGTDWLVDYSLVRDPEA